MNRHPSTDERVFADQGWTTEALAPSDSTSLLDSAGLTAEGIDPAGFDYHENPQRPAAGRTPAALADLTAEQLTRVSNEMIALFDTVYDPNLLDPLRYIHASIRRMVDDSGASPALKQRLHGKTPIAVGYRPMPAATSGLIDASALLGPLERRNFTLDEIVTDSYRRQLVDHRQVQVLWPSDFPQALIDTLESANLQARYQAEVERRLSTPQAKLLLKIQTTTEVQSRLEHYARQPQTPQAYKRLIAAYGAGQAKPELVELRTQTSQFSVAQALYLRSSVDKSIGGLLIFLDETEQDAVVPLPREDRRSFIESSSRLARLILRRLPLDLQLKYGKDRLVYVNTFMGPLIRQISPLQFRSADDAFDALHSIRIKRMLSDIDTLVSTDSERLADSVLETGVFIFQGLSVVATLPFGAGGSLAVRLLVSFLLGQGAAALEAIRALNADIPEEAEAHYDAALFAAIAEIVGPLGLVLAGKALSAVSRSRVSARVFKHIKKTRPYPGKTPALDQRIRPDPADLKRIKRQLTHRLAMGPDQAQSLVESQARLLNKTVQGHDLVIYRGRVFRGDLRPPEEIFAKGFELRTPAAEIEKDIHKVTGVRGGFGGGHDALDPDGKGISTSAFYYRDKVGAFVYGGQKGGHTYLIDARKLDGYHLYQNHHNALYPDAPTKIRFKPTEINYGQNIPPSVVLGAYDPLGNFIANDLALRMWAREVAITEIRQRLAAAAAAATIAASVKQPPAQSA